MDPPIGYPNHANQFIGMEATGKREPRSISESRADQKGSFHLEPIIIVRGKAYQSSHHGYPNHSLKMYLFMTMLQGVLEQELPKVDYLAPKNKIERMIPQHRPIITYKG
jgi:hypothetical protein